MKADTLTLKQVFQKDIRYVVPMFQRPYVWNQTKHWEPLWEDVRTTTERLMRSIHSDETLDAAHAEQATVPHFLGAIVVDQLLAGVVEVDARHVIDGQQRLTTLQLLLDAVQEAVADHGVTREAKLLSKLILNDVDIVSEPDHRFKVWPTNIDRDAFRAAMDDEQDSSQFRGSAVADAHAFFLDQASRWIAEGDDVEDRSKALCTALHGLFQLVVIDLEPHDNAQVIFETLNARGTPLLAADLVKNHVMQAALAKGLNAEDLYEQHWKDFDSPNWRRDVKQGRLIRPRIDMFLDFWLEVQSGNEVPAHDVFPEFRRHLLRSGNNVVGVVTALARDGKVFERLHAPRDHSPEGTFLYRWDAMEAQVITPLLLWLFAHDETELPREQLRLALSSIESFLVRRMVVRLTTKNYNQLFLSLLAAARDGETNAAGTRISEFLAGQTADASYWPDDAEFVRALLSEPLYSRLKRARLRMMLEALEDELRTAKTEDEHVTRNKLTIEHLLPQGWSPEIWPLPKDDEPAAETLRRNVLLHTLGNLTLVTDRLNPDLSNRSWEYKRPRIDQHGVLRLHASFKNATYWGEDEILDRSRLLAELALAVWPRPGGSEVDFNRLADEALNTVAAEVTDRPGTDRADTDPDNGLAWMINEDILAPGEPLMFTEPSRNQTFEATVDGTGAIVLPGGERFWSPSGAAKHCLARNTNGWRRWRVPRLGDRTLWALRKEFQVSTDEDADQDDEM